MELPEKKERVNAYIKTDRTDYVEFLNSLEEGRVNWVENARHKDSYLEENPIPESNMEWLGTGLYGEIVDQPKFQELDFEKFSYSIMKEIVDDQDLLDTMEAVMEAEEGHRRKRLRVYLFECMKKPNSPYYNIEKYREIHCRMVEAKEIAESFIEDEGYTVHAKTFDSFSFLASTDEAEQVRDKINDELGLARMDLDTFKSVVSFRNIGHFQTMDGDWREVMTGGTPGYDEVKREIVNCLKELDFNCAHKTISKARKAEEPFEDLDLSEDALRKYNADLNEMKQNLKQKDLHGFGQ
jgi:hypothetical protein